MRSREYAQILLRKAAQDELAMKLLLSHPESPDDAVGFHAQQAVEKLLKAVLVSKEVRYRWRHDLVELIDLMIENGIAFPPELEDVRRLNPFAVELRYDDLPEGEDELLDRQWASNCVKRLTEWAESIVNAHQ